VKGQPGEGESVCRLKGGERSGAGAGAALRVLPDQPKRAPVARRTRGAAADWPWLVTDSSVFGWQNKLIRNKGLRYGVLLCSTANAGAPEGGTRTSSFWLDLRTRGGLRRSAMAQPTPESDCQGVCRARCGGQGGGPVVCHADRARPCAFGDCGVVLHRRGSGAAAAAATAANGATAAALGGQRCLEPPRGASQRRRPGCHGSGSTVGVAAGGRGRTRRAPDHHRLRDQHCGHRLLREERLRQVRWQPARPGAAEDGATLSAREHEHEPRRGVTGSGSKRDTCRLAAQRDPARKGFGTFGWRWQVGCWVEGR